MVRYFENTSGKTRMIYKLWYKVYPKNIHRTSYRLLSIIYWRFIKQYYDQVIYMMSNYFLQDVFVAVNFNYYEA